MSKLHEILAVENTKKTALGKLIDDTKHKFGKFEFFQGLLKSLKMINESPENAALERSAAESRALPTTVHETLEYLMKYFSEYEDLQFQKNKTNQQAVADLMFRGELIHQGLPVDQLLGLEDRLTNLRKVADIMPTLPAAKEWEANDNGRKGEWKAVVQDRVVKTEKKTEAHVLYPATDKHPAQVEKFVRDVPVGEFIQINFCGAATSKQKAEVTVH